MISAIKSFFSSIRNSFRALYIDLCELVSVGLPAWSFVPMVTVLATVILVLSNSTIIASLFAIFGIILTPLVSFALIMQVSKIYTSYNNSDMDTMINEFLIFLLFLYCPILGVAYTVYSIYSFFSMLITVDGAYEAVVSI